MHNAFADFEYTIKSWPFCKKVLASNQKYGRIKIRIKENTDTIYLSVRSSRIFLNMNAQENQLISEFYYVVKMKLGLLSDSVCATRFNTYLSDITFSIARILLLAIQIRFGTFLLSM